MTMKPEKSIDSENAHEAGQVQPASPRKAAMKVLWNIVAVAFGLFVLVLFASSISQNNQEAAEKNRIAHMTLEQRYADADKKEQIVLNRFAHIRDRDYKMSGSEKTYWRGQMALCAAYIKTYDNADESCEQFRRP